MATDDAPWTGGTITALIASVFCMAPTAATLLIVVATVIVPLSAGFMAGAMSNSSAGKSGGALLAIAAALSMVASFPVSIASVVLHPIGAATAWLMPHPGPAAPSAP